MRHPRTLACFAMLLSAPALLAQTQDTVYVPVARYETPGGVLAVSANAWGIALRLQQGDRNVQLTLDAEATRTWADSTERTLNLKGGEPAGDSIDFDSRVLRHPQTDHEGGLLLTRSFFRQPSRCFLTAWVGEDESLTIQLTDRQAREVLSAFRRAAESSQRSASVALVQLDAAIKATETRLRTAGDSVSH